jgi:hypothetical protein
MTSDRQKALMLQNLMRLLGHANAAANRADLDIEVAAARIANIVRGLPEEPLLREQAWRRAMPEVLTQLTGMSNAVGRELLNEFGMLLPEQAEWAAKYLNAQERYSYTPPWAGEGQSATVQVGAFSSDAPGQAAANRVQYGFNSGYLPRTTELLGQAPATFKPSDLWGGGRSPDQLAQMPLRVPDWVYKIVKDSRITGFKVREFFGDSAVLQEDADFGRFVRGQGLGGTTRVQLPDGRSVPRFAKFSYTNLDRNVRSGFLSGLTNEEISRNIIFDEIRGKMRLGTNAVRLKSDARAAARTLLADMAERVHQEQWKEMDRWEWTDDKGEVHSGNIIQSWRWDSSLDSRVCETCSLLDNKRANERKGLPAIPRHPNCRCSVLPETETTRQLEEEDAAAGVTRSAVGYTRDIPKQRPGEKRSDYVRRMKDQGYSITKTAGPSGERWYRKRMQTRADSVPAWLEEQAKRGNADDLLSLQEHFGGNNAGAQRAAYFRKRVLAGANAQDVLVDITRKVGSSGMRTWVPVASLRRRMPEIKEAQPILSPRQAKELAKARRRGNPSPALRDIPAPRRGY